ncbi:methylmalonyl Co-A mutase-associated GTPase MeaB [Proteiniborus ethanoligenes]|uniref:methylmalonyl Co-A mutase-associated GTPase MeaB n=1 Tax=Proteiniborus ethanoligenes TaxID=415015 RepID=UPI00313A2DAD
MLILEYVEKLLNGDKRTCARLISMVENNEEEAKNIIKDIYRYTGKAHIVGITGPPGGGKSTMTDKLAKELRKRGKTVGIIAIDPTSPFTGGAILGDRIRMQDLATDPGVFIRSMGTRGHLGGLSKATQNALKILDVYGVDYIIIETVGVGQSEIDIVKTADTVVMVMVPGLGDDIQAIKAGVMEIGDIFAINKSDLDGAARTQAELKAMLDMSPQKSRRPPIVPVVSSLNKGIDTLLDEIINHMEYLKSSGELKTRRENNVQMEIIKLMEAEIMKMVLQKSQKEHILEKTIKEVAERKTDPFTASESILNLL